MALVLLFLAYQHGSFLSHSAQRPSGSFCWLGSQHNMFKHQKHTHHPPRLLGKKKKVEKTVTKLVSVNMWSQQLSGTFTSPWNAAELLFWLKIWFIQLLKNNSVNRLIKAILSCRPRNIFHICTPNSSTTFEAIWWCLCILFLNIYKVQRNFTLTNSTKVWKLWLLYPKYLTLHQSVGIESKCTLCSDREMTFDMHKPKKEHQEQFWDEKSDS